MMRILVTGGRDFANANVVNMALDAVHRKRGIELLIEGGARGADTLARDWALARGIPLATVRADWKRYRNAAGIMRNASMLARFAPHAVVAFPGGSGTADMIARAEAAGVPVWRVKVD